MVDEVVECELTSAFVYKSDAIPTKTGFVSISGKYAFYNNRYEHFSKKKGKNFVFYLLPYILLMIVFVILAIMEYLIPGENNEVEKIMTSISGYTIIATMIIFLVSAISFMRNNDLTTIIGNPENTIYECSGTIDVSTGTIQSSRVTAYDTYSGIQIIEMIGNIIKFVIVYILLVLLGWIYWIIFIIRMMGAKKKAKEILFEIVNKGEDFLTNVLVCEGTAQVLTPEDVYIKCKSGTRLEGNFKYYDTFYFDNVIYGLFNNIEDENSFEIVKILPRYQGYVIESEEEFTKLINIYKELGR